jgi:hypothetical protein
MWKKMCGLIQTSTDRVKAEEMNCDETLIPQCKEVFLDQQSKYTLSK